MDLLTCVRKQRREYRFAGDMRALLFIMLLV